MAYIFFFPVIYIDTIRFKLIMVRHQLIYFHVMYAGFLNSMSHFFLLLKKKKKLFEGNYSSSNYLLFLFIYVFLPIYVVYISFKHINAGRHICAFFFLFFFSLEVFNNILRSFLDPAQCYLYVTASYPSLVPCFLTISFMKFYLIFLAL